MNELKPGDTVIVVTRWGANGSRSRLLFRYETAASWYETFLDGIAVRYETACEPWDGVEHVCFDNGD